MKPEEFGLPLAQGAVVAPQPVRKKPTWLGAFGAWLGALCFSVCACTGQPAREAAIGPQLRPTGWDAADACSILDKAVVAEVMGARVTSAELGRVTGGTRQMAAFSECTYHLADGRRFSFFARKSPVLDNTPDALAQAKLAAALYAEVPPQDVPGVGRAAFWLHDVNQLQFFLGEDRYAYVSLPSDDPIRGRLAAVALARRVGA